jgi:hypothetical protein
MRKWVLAPARSSACPHLSSRAVLLVALFANFGSPLIRSSTAHCDLAHVHILAPLKAAKSSAWRVMTVPRPVPRQSRIVTMKLSFSE